MNQPIQAELAPSFESSSSIQSRVYVMLRDMIDDGRIAPGERLLEARVAKSFGISRSPARGALAALCNDKLLVESEGRGYCVAGQPEPGLQGRSATLDPIALTAMPQWARMYRAVERELCTRVLFGTVRITEEALAHRTSVQ